MSQYAKTSVILLLVKDGKLLLQQRLKKDVIQHMYAPVAGKIEPLESPTDAVIREAMEEAGITINADDLSMVCTLHWADYNGKDIVEFYFICSKYSGTPAVMEPDIALSVDFYPLDNLPENTVSSIPLVLKALEEKRIYIERCGV